MLTDLQKLLSEKIEQGQSRTLDLIETNPLGTGFRRIAYNSLAESFASFLKDKTGRSRWTIITGLRGVGKTTLLAQLYHQPSIGNCTRFYLSLDDIQATGATVNDITAVIEYHLKIRISANPNPVFLFLDEVHFIPKWSLVAKVLFDNSRNLFLVCTGSSAISFWANPDIGRRAKMIRLPPLNFQEFIGIESLYRKLPTADEVQGPPKSLKSPALDIALSAKLKEFLFGTASAQATYNQLKQMQVKTDKDRSNRDDINGYINLYGSLPYAAELKYQRGYYNNSPSGIIPQASNHQRQTTKDADNEIRERILQTLNSLFSRDLEVLGQFSPKTKPKFLRLLLMLANADSINLGKIGKNLGLNLLTVQNMLKALIDAEIISPVAPLGASLGKIAKPYKYFFTSPGLRLSLSSKRLDVIEGRNSANSANLRDQLLEETVAMYLKRLFVGQTTAGIIEYDPRAGGADFVIMPNGLKSEAIVLGVGYGKTDTRQITNTLKRLKGGYGLVVTDRPLSLNKDQNTVFVPLKTFLML